MDRTEAERNTPGDVLKRYVKEVSPTKKGQAAEALHSRSILKYSICHLRMSVTGRKSMSSMLRYSHVRGMAVAEKLSNLIGHQPTNLQQQERNHEGS